MKFKCIPLHKHGYLLVAFVQKQGTGIRVRCQKLYEKCYLMSNEVNESFYFYVLQLRRFRVHCPNVSECIEQPWPKCKHQDFLSVCLRWMPSLWQSKSPISTAYESLHRFPNGSGMGQKRTATGKEPTFIDQAELKVVPLDVHTSFSQLYIIFKTPLVMD